MRAYDVLHLYTVDLVSHLRYLAYAIDCYAHHIWADPFYIRYVDVSWREPERKRFSARRRIQRVNVNVRPYICSKRGANGCMGGNDHA